VGRVRRRGIGHEAEGGRAVVVIVLVVLVMAMGGWVAAYAGANGKVPRGTTIAGIAVGGHGRYDAVQVLAQGIAAELRQPMSITVGTVTTQVTPEQAGLSVDYVESIAHALGPRSWDPRKLWGYYTGGSDLAPVVDVDQSKMDAVLGQLEQQIGQPPVDGAIAFVGGQMQVTEAQDGAQIPREQGSRAIVDAWSAGRRDVTLPLQLSAPAIDAAALQTAITTLANPAMSAPVTLTFAGSQVTLSPQQYLEALSIVPRDGTLALEVDQDTLAGLVHPGAQDTNAADASVVFSNGAPTVTPAVDGQAYDAPGVAAAFLQAVTATDAGRTVAVTGTATPAAYTTDNASSLGIREIVSSYGVAAAGPGLATGAARLTGVVLKPGDTLSFAGSVGDLGDPASSDRLATATWNAAFLAGLTDVSRPAPTTYGDGMPEGRDVAATLGDLQVRNDTDHGVMFSAHTDGATVTVDVWSTKEYDVAASVGARYNAVARTTRTDTDPACVGAPGADGFSVDLTRTVTKTGSGEAVRSDTVTTTYQPQEAVVCSVAPPPV
jgi:vancomycin resistance protein YoaR